MLLSKTATLALTVATSTISPNYAECLPCQQQTVYMPPNPPIVETELIALKWPALKRPPLDEQLLKLNFPSPLSILPLIVDVPPESGPLSSTVVAV